MTFRAASYNPVDPGVYGAVLDGIEEGSNEYGDFRKWRFLVQTADGEQTVSAMTSGASGPRSKAYKWASTLLGHKPSGEEETLSGLPCQLVLVINEDGYNRISDLLPPKAGGSTVNLERLDQQVFADQAEIPF